MDHGEAPNLLMAASLCPTEPEDGEDGGHNGTQRAQDGQVPIISSCAHGKWRRGKSERRREMGALSSSICSRPPNVPRVEPCATDSLQCTRARRLCALRFGLANGSTAERSACVRPCAEAGAISITGAKPCALDSALTSSTTAGSPVRIGM